MQRPVSDAGSPRGVDRVGDDAQDWQRLLDGRRSRLADDDVQRLA